MRAKSLANIGQILAQIGPCGPKLGRIPAPGATVRQLWDKQLKGNFWQLRRSPGAMGVTLVGTHDEQLFGSFRITCLSLPEPVSTRPPAITTKSFRPDSHRNVIRALYCRWPWRGQSRQRGNEATRKLLESFYAVRPGSCTTCESGNIESYPKVVKEFFGF